MIRQIIWKVIRVGYVYIIKPILFLTPPDEVHNRMIWMAGAVGRSSFLCGFTKWLFVGRRNIKLQQTFHGVKFDSPVGLSAGFDKNAEVVGAISAIGFGFGTVGSVTAQVCAGNPRPWFYRLPKTQSLIINAGLGNQGSKIIIERIKTFSSTITNQFPIVLSVAKTNSCEVVDEKSGIDDYVISVKRARDVKNIKMVELNISCPNAFGGEQFITPDKLHRLLTAVDKVESKNPVLVKMPSHLPWAEFKALLDVIVKHRVVAVTISNLAKDRTKADLKDELPDSVKGNMSGFPVRQISNDLIRQTYINYGEKLTIIGVGGIFSADDAYEKIKLGASLVELITGMVFYGPQLIAEINDGLVQLLERDGYENISQAIGVDSRRD